MDNSKIKLTWRQTALFTAALGASFLLNGQVGHADQTAAGQQQTVSAQNNVAVQGSESAEAAQGTNSANTLSGKEQSPSAEPAQQNKNITIVQNATSPITSATKDNAGAMTSETEQSASSDQPIEIISDDLNKEACEQHKKELQHWIAEYKYDQELTKRDSDEAIQVAGQIGALRYKMYRDYLRNPQNYDSTNAPAEVQKLLHDLGQLRQKIATQQKAVDEEQQLVTKKQKTTDDWQRYVDEQEKKGASYQLQTKCLAKLNEYILDLGAHQSKLANLKSELGTEQTKYSNLLWDGQNDKKYSSWIEPMLAKQPELAKLHAKVKTLLADSNRHDMHTIYDKNQIDGLRKVVASLSVENYAIYKLITRTIHIIVPGAAPINIKQVAKCSAHQIQDGKKITYEDWQKDSWSWKAYTPATYFGYTCDVDRVPSVTVDHNTPNQTVTITYTAQPGLNSSYNHDDQGNYACLDHYQLNGTQLQVSGWHATSDVKNKPYHYLIVFDNTTNSEVMRRMVGQTARPDVAVAHNVYGAGLAGFQANLDLPTAILRSGDRLSLVSRYTDDQSGNGNGTDYWFGGSQIDQGNHGYLDVVQVQNGKLHVAGWHATNQAVGRDHHVLILFDASQGREIARLNATAAARPDIAKIYPMISNAATAGFTADFALTPAMATDNLQVISRYSSDANANSDYVDFWSTPRRLTTDLSNQGWLDDVSIRDGQLHITGWHATNLALGRRYHTIIILNANTGKEIARQTTDQLVERTDLVRAFPNVLTAQQSGINVTMQLKPGMADQPIQIISRYSTTADANSDYVDYWFNPQRLVKDAGNYANLDGFGIRDGKIYASGWHASDRSLGRPYHYIIVFDATPGINRELMRFDVTKQEVSRPDVARAYPQLLTAQNAGFNISFANDPNFTNGHQLQIVSRWTDDPAGNGNAVDYWFKPRLIEL